jgi:fructoselysine 6-kinase
MPRIVTLMEACIDVAYGDTMGFPGGNASNVAVWARRGGVDAAFLGAVGTDLAGARLLALLGAEGVDVSGAVRHPGFTAWTLVGDAAHGMERFICWDGGVTPLFSLEPDQMPSLASADFVHLPLYPEWVGLAEALALSGVRLSLDIGALGDMPLPPALAARCHIVFASAQDSAQLAEAAVAELLALGCGIVVVSLGGDGAIAGDATGVFHAPARQVATPDTLGAGDALAGAMLAALASGATLASALANGTEAGSRACRTRGAFGHGFRLPQDLKARMAEKIATLNPKVDL